MLPVAGSTLGEAQPTRCAGTSLWKTLKRFSQITRAGVGVEAEQALLHLLALLDGVDARVPQVEPVAEDDRRGARRRRAPSRRGPRPRATNGSAGRSRRRRRRGSGRATRASRRRRPAARRSRRGRRKRRQSSCLRSPLGGARRARSPVAWLPRRSKHPPAEASSEPVLSCRASSPVTRGIQRIARRFLMRARWLPVVSLLAPRGARRRRGSAALGPVARPRRTGNRERPERAARVEPDEERALEDRDPRPRLLLAGRVGRPHLPDDGDRGRRRSRSEGRQAHHGGPGVRAPRRRGRRPPAHLQGGGARRPRAAASCGRRPPGRARPTTRATGAAASRRPLPCPTARSSTPTSARKGSTPTTSRATSSGAGRRAGSPASASGSAPRRCSTATIVIVQCDEDNGEKSFIVGLDRKTGKEVWRTPRQDRGELGDADPGEDRRPRRARHRRQPGDHRLRPEDGTRAVADEGPREQRGALAGGGRRDRRAVGRLPGEDRRGGASREARAT